MDLTSLAQALAAHQWLALLLMFSVYVRKLLSDGSAFPLTLSVNVRPLVVGFAGAVVTTITVEQAGAAWGVSILAGFAGLVGVGFFDGMLVAIFGSPSAAPTWAKAIVFLIDDAGKGSGGGGGSSAAKLDPVTRAANALNGPKPPPPAATFGRRSGVFSVFVAALLIACIATLLSACGASQAQVVSGIDTGLNAGICVLNTYSADISAGDSEPQAIADTVIKCGTSAAQSSNILAAHRKAEVSEGYVLRPSDAGK